MSAQRQHDWRLALGLLASLLAHGVVALAIGMNSLGLSADSGSPPPPAIQPPKLTPGVDHSRAVTISWIGFEEPTPHQAEQAATDQPALARGPAPSPAPPADAAPPVAPVSPPVEPAEPTELVERVEPVKLSETATSRPLPTLPLPPKTLDDLLAQLDQPTETKPEKPKITPVPKPSKPKAVEEKPKATAKPAPAPSASPAGGGPRESPPTSQQKPRKIKPGKPVALEGLRINTVAPQFSTITRLTSAPHNPLIRVTFNTLGKAVTAEVLESSGDIDVDRPVLDAVYQWTATGEKLDELRKKDPKQLTTFEFRIMLR